MSSFKKSISPKSRLEHERFRDDMRAFQSLPGKDMSARLLAESRAMIDSGTLSCDPRHSYDEWGLFRVIPQIARRLDPDIDLRSEEIPKAGEEKDILTHLETADNARLAQSVNSILSHASYARINGNTASDEAVNAKRLLIGNRQITALTVAMDTLAPGSFPDRARPDTKPPLPGSYVIAEQEIGRDRVLLYTENNDEAERAFDLALSISRDPAATYPPRDGGPLFGILPETYHADGTLTDDSLWERMCRVHDCDKAPLALSLQDYDGTILRREDVDCDPAPEP